MVRENWFNAMAAFVQASYCARSSAAMVLNMQDKLVFDFNKKGF